MYLFNPLAVGNLAQKQPFESSCAGFWLLPGQKEPKLPKMVFLSQPHCNLLLFMLSSMQRKQTVNLKIVFGQGFLFRFQ